MRNEVPTPTQVDPAADQAGTIADPIEQARELLRLIRAGKSITGGGVERDAAALIAASQLATAYHIQRIANSIESLIAAINNDGLFADLAGATMDAIADDMRSGNPGTPAAGG